MVSQPREFDTNFYYHAYNRGVEKRTIFETGRDYQRFLDTLRFYLHDQKSSFNFFQRLTEEKRKAYLKANPQDLNTRRVHLIAYCLMPNHFHLLLKGARYDGVTSFLSDISNSHTRYFNIKHERVGRLFQGPFKSKEISDEGSLLQVSRYIHINPVPAGLAKKPENYHYSSYKTWIGQGKNSLLSRGSISGWLKKFGGAEKYKKFVEAKIGETVKDSKRGIENLVLE